jgi:hypothetical protein
VKYPVQCPDSSFEMSTPFQRVFRYKKIGFSLFRKQKNPNPRNESEEEAAERLVFLRTSESSR